MLPKTGKKFLGGNDRQNGGLGYAAIIASVLAKALGETHRAAKVLMGWTGAGERTVKHWLAGIRQMTTGGKPRLGGITRRGNVYLRTMLIHGARAALPGLSRSDTPLGPRCLQVVDRDGLAVERRP